MNVEFEIKLIEALDALDRGEPIDAILARYPDSAAELRPMLSTTAALPAMRMQPSEAQKITSRQAFLKQGAALRQASQRRPATGLVPRLATMFAALSVACAVLGGGAVAASGSALPGDPLYSLKRTVEDARLTFTADAAARANLQAQFEAQRRIEANALLDAGREIEVRFGGPIESIQPDAWVVGGLVVRIDANTQISGQPQIDRLADVRGLTGRRGLRALSITLDQPAEPTPESPTSTPTPTDAPAPAPTATPNPIVTPEPTEPRPTREPPPTAMPAPTPRPVSIEFTGSVNSQTADSWVIDGATVAIDANTVFKGNIGVGQRVTVQALRHANGRLLATRIELITDDEGGSGGNGNGNDNGDNQNNDNNHNENNNANHNENENENDNANHNENENANTNENANDNTNDNTNENENDNRNSNDNG